MKIQKAVLQHALEKVSPGLANKEIIEQSTHFAFIKDRVVTFNGEISVSCIVPGLDLEGAVSAKPLHQILAKIKKDEVDITITDEELLVSGGRAKAGLPILAEVRLPIKEEIGAMGKWKPMPLGLQEAMQACRFSASKDMSFATLTCVHVVKEGSLVESCDRSRLTRCTFEGVLPIGDFLIPAESVEALKAYSTASISVGDGWVHFMSEDKAVVFSCRIYNEQYPDLGKAMEMPEQIDIEFPPALMEILERASVFTAKSEKNTQPFVEIALSQKRIKIRAKGDAGWFEEEVNARYVGEPLTFTVNPDFLKEMLPKATQCAIGSQKLRFAGDNWEHIISMATKGE